MLGERHVRLPSAAPNSGTSSIENSEKQKSNITRSKIRKLHRLDHLNALLKIPCGGIPYFPVVVAFVRLSNTLFSLASVVAFPEPIAPDYLIFIRDPSNQALRHLLDVANGELVWWGEKDSDVPLR